MASGHARGGGDSNAGSIRSPYLTHVELEEALRPYAAAIRELAEFNASGASAERFREQQERMVELTHFGQVPLSEGPE